jgi:recombination protein RecA
MYMSCHYSVNQSDSTLDINLNDDRLPSKRLNDDRFYLQTIGSQVAVKIVKNKHAPPFKTAHFELEFGKGICRSFELIELGLKHKLIKKGGGRMYTYNDLGFRGKEAFKLYLNEHESVAKALEMTLRQLMEQEAPKEEAEGDSPNDLPEEIVSPGTSSEEELASVIEA